MLASFFEKMGRKERLRSLRSFSYLSPHLNPITMSSPTKLNEAQRALLRLFDRGMTDDEVRELKQLLTRFYAAKARDEADRVVAERGYTEDDFNAMLNAGRGVKYFGHLRFNVAEAVQQEYDVAQNKL